MKKLSPKLKTLYKRTKPYLRWFILALTLGFILHTLRLNWQQVLTLRFGHYAIAQLLLALGFTLSAHIWSGWVWYGILRLLNAPIAPSPAVIAYLTTNLSKYLPGNVWHYVGRIQFLRSSGTPTGVAITGVVLEPLLMAVAALAIVLITLPSTVLQIGILVAVLIAVHPKILNPLLKRLATAKLKQSEVATESIPPIPELNQYPIRPLLGELGFVILRGLGFLLCFAALSSLGMQDVWTLMGAFSLAWLLGLIVPGAPGGLGVFEATALAVLTPQFPAAIVLGVVALYRLNGTLAEVLGAGLAILDDRWNAHKDAPNALLKKSDEKEPTLGSPDAEVIPPIGSSESP